MKIYDVSVPISEKTPVYAGDPMVEITVPNQIAKGDAANVSRICCGVHTATHVDAPAHFVEGGRKIDALPLEILIGEARVVEIGETETAVSVEHIENANLAGVERVLFKTRNSQFWNDSAQGFRKDFAYIEPDAAQMLVDLGVKLVGIDYLSVEKFGSTDFGAHYAFLKNHVVIIEGLDLREVSAGVYELICLPLKLAGGTGDGAPARTVLREIKTTDAHG